MIQVQAAITYANGDLTLECNLLEREDANDVEREIGYAIESLHLKAYEKMRANGVDMKITRICSDREVDDDGR